MSSEYGIYLLDENGGVFYEDSMDVISFKDKISLNHIFDRGAFHFDLLTPVDIPIIPFIRYRTNNIDHTKVTVPYCELNKNKNGNWELFFVSLSSNLLCDIDIYIFSINLIQPVPDHGLAIFNKNGMCVLTNETKRLNLKNSGEICSYKTIITLEGSFAVFPQYSGGAVFQWRDPHGGDVFIYDIDFSYAAIYHDNQTRIYGGAATSAGGGPISSASFVDAYAPSLYIDTSPYD